MMKLWWMLHYKNTHRGEVWNSVLSAATERDAWKLLEEEYGDGEYIPIYASIVVPFGLTYKDLGLTEGATKGTCGIIDEWWNGEYQYIDVYRRNECDKLYRRLSVLWRTDFGWEEDV